MTIANMMTMMILVIAATYTEILTMMLTVLMMMMKKKMMMKLMLMMVMMMIVMMMMQSMRPWPCLLIPCDHTRGLRGRPAHFTESRNLDFIDSVNPRFSTKIFPFQSSTIT